MSNVKNTVFIILLSLVVLLSIFNNWRRESFQAHVESSHHEQEQRLIQKINIKTRDRFTGQDGKELERRIAVLESKIE